MTVTPLPQNPTLAAWLAPLSESTRSSYLRALAQLAAHRGTTESAAVTLLTSDAVEVAAGAVRAFSTWVAGTLDASTARVRVAALCSLAKHAGRDLGVQQRRGGYRPRRAAPSPDEAKAKRAATLPPPADVAGALVLWAPTLRRIADLRGLTVPGLLAEAVSVLGAERSGPGLQHVGKAARELEVMAGDLAPVRAAAPAKPPREASTGRSVAARPLVPREKTLQELRDEQDAEIAEIERLAAEREGRA